MAGQVFHAPFINHIQDFCLHTIRTSNPENIELAKERYPETSIVGDSSEIFGNEEIDLVVIATPNVSHFALGKEALESGKNVVIDKPFTATVQQAEELIALANSNDKMLSVFQNRRWDSDFLTVKQMVHSEKLGRIVEYEAHYDRFRPSLRENSWKEENDKGNGILYDLGSHLIDQALTLFGLPKAVFADIRKQREGSEIDDNFELILFYDALKVTLKAGALVAGSLPKYMVLGDKGSFIKYGLDVQEADLNNGDFSFDSDSWGMEKEENWGTLYLQGDEGVMSEKVVSLKGNYSAYYENIKDVLLGEDQLHVKSNDGKNVIKIIALAEKSNELKRVVEL